MKLWDKGIALDRQVEAYTVGRDIEVGLQLLPYDCQASLAHARMLHKIGVLTASELTQLEAGLSEILALHSKGQFKIETSDEDCHTAIERHLTEKCGQAGQKIHTGRSRNDQVLVALSLYQIAQLRQLQSLAQAYVSASKAAQKKYGSYGMAGYTHMQKAMPSSVGLWLGCYESAMADNLLLIEAQLKLLDQNPLGTGAGYGIPVFDLDRKMTSKELGFSKALENPIYAQHARAKFIAGTLGVLTQVMYDLNRLATDLTFFSMSEFGFAKLPAEFTTGSSIMPQKRNPDVCELMRAKYHLLVGWQVQLLGLSSNLLHGYNRDMQLSSEILIDATETTLSSLSMATAIVSKVEFDQAKCEASLTPELFATQEAYKLVKEGMPFREAYKKVGEKYKR